MPRAAGAERRVRVGRFDLVVPQSSIPRPFPRSRASKSLPRAASRRTDLSTPRWARLWPVDAFAPCPFTDDVQSALLQPKQALTWGSARVLKGCLRSAGAYPWGGTDFRYPHVL